MKASPNTKQVIVLRKFKNLRTGKYAAQASHASIAFLTSRMKEMTNVVTSSEEQNHWLNNSFRKIVCCVDTELELQEVYDRALEAGLTAHKIVDNGATEFGGVPTSTAVAIGPHWDHRFEGVTDSLRLF